MTKVGVIKLNCWMWGMGDHDRLAIEAL